MFKFYVIYFRKYENESDRQSDSDQPSLSVLNISLPNHIKAFNTGSSITRWANKRPRLKSARITHTKNKNNLDSENLDVSSIIDELQKDTENSMKNVISIRIENEEIDPDIQLLLEKTHVEEEKAREESKKISFDFSVKSDTDYKDDNNNNNSKNKVKRKGKKKRKEKEKKSKKKLTKTVSFSLSKPPTPQTEQIIRVDVISNFSVEFEDAESTQTDGLSSNHCNKQNGQKLDCQSEDEKSLFQIFCKQKLENGKDLILESKKAVLFNRSDK